jgi:hypothetical protein
MAVVNQNKSCAGLLRIVMYIIKPSRPRRLQSQVLPSASPSITAKLYTKFGGKTIAVSVPSICGGLVSRTILAARNDHETRVKIAASKTSANWLLMICPESMPARHRIFKLVLVPLLIFSLLGQLAVVWTQLPDMRDGYFDFACITALRELLMMETGGIYTS